MKLLAYTPFLIQELLSCRFEKYVDYALDVPMYFVYRNSQYIDCSGLSFRVINSAIDTASNYLWSSLNFPDGRTLQLHVLHNALALGVPFLVLKFYKLVRLTRQSFELFGLTTLVN